jgi:hypothetical protein
MENYLLISFWIDRFPLPTAARTAKMGLGLGITFGLLQDMAGMLRGRQPGYVRFALGLPDRWKEPASEEKETG